MRWIGPMFSLLAALVLAGCNPPAPAAAPEPAPPAVAVTPAPVKTPEPSPEPTPAPESEPAVESAEEPPAQAPGKRPVNENRVYQLDELEVVEANVGRHKFRLWVMNTPGKMQEGMMHLSDAEVKADEGMVFVYPEPQPLSFWMRNTRLPLDIAFLDSRRRILNIEAMKPFDENPTPSRGSALYAVELKQGTFRRLGIRAGDVFEFARPLKFVER